MTNFEQGEGRNLAAPAHANLEHQYSYANPENRNIFKNMGRPSDRNDIHSSSHEARILHGFSISFSDDRTIELQRSQFAKQQAENHTQKPLLADTHSYQFHSPQPDIYHKSQPVDAHSSQINKPQPEIHQSTKPVENHSAGNCEVVWATYYNPTGNRTADGHKYDSTQTGHLMGVAVDLHHPVLGAGLGDELKITDPTTGKSVTSIVHDKGNFNDKKTSDHGAHRRGVDMTVNLAKEFGFGPGKHNAQSILVEVCSD